MSVIINLHGLRRQHAGRCDVGLGYDLSRIGLFTAGKRRRRWHRRMGTPSLTGISGLRTVGSCKDIKVKAVVLCTRSYLWRHGLETNAWKTALVRQSWTRVTDLASHLQDEAKAEK
jgi:hypothetical protein